MVAAENVGGARKKVTSVTGPENRPYTSVFIKIFCNRKKVAKGNAKGNACLTV